MNIFHAVILGIVQGLTEFLPVSSTAHLVIAQNLLGLKESPTLLVFDIVVHLGTLLSLLIYFAKDFFPIPKIGKRMFWFIIVATIPTGVIGLLFKHFMEESFNSLWFTIITLFFNSIILLSTYWTKASDKKDLGDWRDAFWIGVSQGISILPGISRSGATVSTALWLKIKPEDAARFSFFIAIPAILGATVIVLPDALPHVSSSMWSVMLAGFVAAFISGWFAISWVFKVVFRGKFHYFAFYTFLLTFVTAIYALLQK